MTAKRVHPLGGDRAPAVHQVIEDLRTTLARAGALAAVLEDGMADWQAGETRLTELAAELAAVKAENRDMSQLLTEAERQAERLMNLYVVIYQLHGTFVPAEVEATIVEISVNLLGAKRVALLLRDGDGDRYRVCAEEGLASDPSGRYVDGRYHGGDPLVEAALSERILCIAAGGGAAAVPLILHDAVVGVLVLLELLDHRPALGDDDRELLDLLCAHAASALVAAHAYASTHRKLRTLEALVKLACRESHD